MTKNIFAIFFLVTLFVGCTQPINNRIPQQMEAFLKDFSGEILERYNLITTSSGGDFQNKIKKVAINFTSDYTLDKTKAVFLIQRISDDLLFYLNRNQDLMEFLSPKPFTRAQIDINIDFIDNQIKDYVSYPFVASIKLKQGRISLYTHDEKTKQLVLF